jgi:hypothetical protein
MILHYGSDQANWARNLIRFILEPGPVSRMGSSISIHARSSQLAEWPGPLEITRPLIVGRLSNLDIARSQLQGAGSTCGAGDATGHYRCNAKDTKVRQSAPCRNSQLHNSSKRSLADAFIPLLHAHLRSLRVAEAKSNLPLCPPSRGLAVRRPVMNSDVILRPVAVIGQRFRQDVAARCGIEAT